MNGNFTDFRFTGSKVKMNNIHETFPLFKINKMNRYLVGFQQLVIAARPIIYVKCIHTAIKFKNII